MSGQGQDEIVVPSKETMAKFKPGESTLRCCGWCKYVGSGTFADNCMVKGRCSLIPLSLPDDPYKMYPIPPVELDKDATLKDYEAADKLDEGAMQGFIRLKKVIEVIIEKVTACGTDDIDIDAVLLWNTECILAKGLNNPTVKAEILARMDNWLRFFAKRVEDRRVFINRFKKNAISEV